MNTWIRSYGAEGKMPGSNTRTSTTHPIASGNVGLPLSQLRTLKTLGPLASTMGRWLTGRLGATGNNWEKGSVKSLSVCSPSF
jgi:hypothetical protein